MVKTNIKNDILLSFRQFAGSVLASLSYFHLHGLLLCLSSAYKRANIWLSNANLRHLKSNMQLLLGLT